MLKLIYIIIFSFLFSGNLSLSLDVSLIQKIKTNTTTFSKRLDSSPLAIGYYSPIMTHRDYSLSVGATFLGKINSNINDINDNYYLLSIYAMPTYEIYNRFLAWIQIGVNKPTNSKYNPGLMYGLGFNFISTERLSIGFSYITNTTSNLFNHNISFARNSVIINYLFDK